MDIMSVVLIVQAAAELLLGWRAGTDGPSTSGATIRMKKTTQKHSKNNNIEGRARENTQEQKVKKTVFLLFFSENELN